MRTVTFFWAASLVAESRPTTITAYETGEHWCAISVCSTGTSGRPVAFPAWSTQLVIGSMLFMNSAVVPTMAKSSWHARTSALRASSALNFESMKSTCTLRPPATPPLALTNLANALTPSTDPWNRPGRAALSTSAITAMRIVSAVTPISPVAGCCCCGRALAVVGASAPTSPIATTNTTQRGPFTVPP